MYRRAQRYVVSRVTGDEYVGETFKATFQKKGLSVPGEPLTKPEIYEELELQLNTGCPVVLDNELSEPQLLGLVWRGNKIDHPGGEHDDYANAAAGAIHLAASKVVNRFAIPCGPIGGMGLEIRRAGLGGLENACSAMTVG